MIKSIHINLHKLARFINFALPLSVILFFVAGTFVSFYFHFLTVAALFLTLVNFAYLRVQKRHTILRNFGIIGQLRYLLESIGPEMRQYLFANDREERPFNRQERAEVYRKAKDLDSSSFFGSKQEFDATEIKVRHAMYPRADEDFVPYSLTFGEERGLEKAYTIDKPIMISGMSFGALGENAVRALARGARKAGIPMNTGEGGYPKHHLKEGCDLIFQMGTAKFGVRDANGLLDESKLIDLAARPEVKMIEIKFSQGAKPGKGGLLPKEKISEEISELRNIRMGEDCVSPTGHPECSDPIRTVEFIARVQDLTGIPVGIKFCLGHPVEFKDLVLEMKRQDRFPDFITVDGSEGGTGAAPKSFIDRVGTPLLPALFSVHRILLDQGVRERLKLNASGKLIKPDSQFVALALGADVISSARGFMLALGCIQAMQCGRNTCPTGITTFDPVLQRGLDVGVKSIRVQNYVKNVVHDLEELLRSTGRLSYRDLTLENLYIPQLSLLAPLIGSNASTGTASQMPLTP